MKFFNKKSLIVLCIFLITVFYVIFNKKPLKKDIEFPKEILKEYIDTINDADINFKLDENFNFEYVSKIIEVRLICGDSNLIVREVTELQKKICEYSNKYNLTQEEGFIIVHTESDFKINAYNKYGNAVGLCQITEPCVREYNNMHGTKYTLDYNQNWKQFEEQVIVTDYKFDIKFESSDNNSCLIGDLLLVPGTKKQYWTQNPNETNTNTVKIGK